MRSGAAAVLACLLAAPAGAGAPALSLGPWRGESATATRSERPTAEVPTGVEVLTAVELRERRQARSLPEAFKELPGIRLQRTAHGQGSPFLRNLTGYHTVLLIDGIRLNNSVFRSGPNEYWNTLDPLAVERLEVVKGPVSVLYGSDAVGGVAQAFTRGPAPKPERWSFAALHRFASAEASNVGRLELSGPLAGGGFFGGVSAKDFGELVGGRDTGLQPKTGYRELDADLKLRRPLGADSESLLAWQRARQESPWRTHATVFGTAWMGTVPGTDKERRLSYGRDLAYARLRLREAAPWLERAELTLSGQLLSEDQFRVRANDAKETQGFDALTLGVGTQLESLSPWGRWTYGAEYYRDEVDTYRTDYKGDATLASVGVQGPVADDSRYDNLGLYASDALPLGERLELLLGGRFNHLRASASTVEDPLSKRHTSAAGHWNAVVGSGRLAWRPRPAWTLYAGLGQGLRAPNLSDLTRFDIADAGEIETPSPDLKPERFLNCELGAKAAEEGWGLEVAVFYLDIRDLVVRAPTGVLVAGLKEVTKRNAGRGFVTGVELEGQSRLGDWAPDWSAGGGLAWLYGEVDAFPASAAAARREPIEKGQPAMGHALLRWDQPAGRGWVEGVVSVAGRARRLSTRDVADVQRVPPGGTPGYAVLSLRGGARLGRGFTVSAAVENLTNQDYRYHASGLNEAGTNVVLTTSWGF